MTERELLLYIADDFGDWIDGDDPVESYELFEHQILVTFASGSKFLITIEDVYE